MWNDLKDTVPSQGQPVVIQYDKDQCRVAYYCEGEFYYLKYDEVLGIMRKEHVEEPVELWTSIWY